MLLVFFLGILAGTTAKVLVEKAQPSQCNCSRVLFNEETTTEPPPTFPTTSFTCWDRYDGYYADIEVDCTIFHYCQTWQFPSGLNETVKWDFACPISTIFNQKILTCTPPHMSFDCQESPNYYWVNYNLTSTTTTPTPTPNATPEFSTPHSNLGQQLIVGGLGARWFNFSDLAHLKASTSAPDTDYIIPENSPQLPNEVFNGANESVVINFPL